MNSHDEVFKLVKKQMDDAIKRMEYSLSWYNYKIIPLSYKYKTTIDGDLMKCQWWFSLRKIQ